MNKMIKGLKHKLTDTKEKKILIENIFSLSILHGLNYILPLLTIPYLVRILGPNYFGLLAYVSSITGIFVLITDYGFNLSATRQISIYRDDEKKVNEIFSAVMMIKTALLLLSLVLMIGLILSVDEFRDNWDLYFITFGMVVGSVIYPVWLFQGMEKMKYITYLDVGIKGFFTLCIFLFVNEPEDYIIVPLLTSLGFMVAGVIALLIVKKQFRVKLIFQSMKVINTQLKEGWHIFYSKMGTAVYPYGIIIILGLFTNNNVVGYFSASEKIVRAIKKLYAPIGQAIFPSIGFKIKNDKKAGLQFVRKTVVIMGSIMFMVSLLLFILAAPIVSLLFGNQYQESILTLRIMAIIPFTYTVSNLLGVQTLINLGYKKEYGLITITITTLSMAFAYILILNYKLVGASLTMIITEILILATLCLFFLFKKLNNSL